MVSFLILADYTTACNLRVLYLFGTVLVREQIFDILEKICEDDIVRSNPDIDLFESDLMDSLGFAELLADIEDDLGILVAPSEVDRSTFNTPNRIVAYLETRSAS